jgi:leucyl aminopeptidase (aminopeptidase T)
MAEQHDDLVEVARIPIELNSSPGMDVVMVADTNTDEAVVEAVAEAVRRHGAEPTVAIMTPRAANGHEPTAPIAEAMRRADLTVDLTTRALGHTDIVGEIRNAGGRVIYMNGLTRELLRGEAVRADVREMVALGKRLRAAWGAAGTVRVTSDQGTDLVADIRGREGFYIAVEIERTDENFMTEAAFPDGEAGVAPVEGTGEGVVVWDTSAEMLGALEEPIQLTIEGGRIASIEGGRQADELVHIVDELGDKHARNCPAEISIGLNPNVRPSGNMREDKKLRGSCHIALGSSAEDGGTLRSNVHIDGVVRRPTIHLDGDVVVRDGEIVLA